MIDTIQTEVDNSKTLMKTVQDKTKNALGKMSGPKVAFGSIGTICIIGLVWWVLG